MSHPKSLTPQNQTPKSQAQQADVGNSIKCNAHRTLKSNPKPKLHAQFTKIVKSKTNFICDCELQVAT
jgi:hypothetical protein